VGGKRNAFGLSVETPEGKRPLGRLKFRPVDINKMNLREIRCSGMDWIDPAQDQRRAPAMSLGFYKMLESS
jgi:hypothetical protein